MRGLWLSWLLIAGLAAGAPPKPEARPIHIPAAAPMPTPTLSAPARAQASPRVVPPRRPALAVPAHPGKNPSVGLGGAAHYDAKKGAVLGGTVMPHRR